LTFDAYVSQQIREHNDRAWLAHTTAGLVRTSKWPKLERMQVKPDAKAPKRRQSWQEQMAIMDRLVIATAHLAKPSPEGMN
jgi:hypothetical protein